MITTIPLLSVGQSNARGPHGDTLTGPFGCFQFHNGQVTPGAPPAKGLDLPQSIPPNPIGYYAIEGGLFRLAASRPRKLYQVAKYAIGGSSAQDWIDTHQSAALAVAANSPWAGLFQAVVWCQGENDCLTTSDPAGYLARLTTIKAAFASALPGAKFIVLQTNSDIADGTTRLAADVATIRAAQASLADYLIDTTGATTVDGLHFHGVEFDAWAILIDTYLETL